MIQQILNIDYIIWFAVLVGGLIVIAVELAIVFVVRNRQPGSTACTGSGSER